jgi:hypothetical protein
MSLRQLKARLKRLERAQTIAQNDPHPGHTFVIGLEQARTLRDDYKRALRLSDKQYKPQENGGPISAAELKEKSRLLARIKESARAIGCPASYGPDQRKNDSDRLRKASCKLGPLTEAEDAEEAQARARALAYYERPEGSIRDLERLEVEFGALALGAHDQQKLDDLRQRYPEWVSDFTESPVYHAIAAGQRAVAAFGVAEAKEEEERRLRRRQERERQAADRDHED